MNILLALAFLFFVGSVIGWVMELLYRNLSKSKHKWINPGFCTGPYVPLYGFGLCFLFLIAISEAYFPIADPFWRKGALFLVMALAMTVTEYIAGVFCLKVLKVRLWDYSDMRFNLQGIICPQFSLIWAVLGAVYYFLIHPHILDALQWLSGNLAFSFVIGLFFGVFLVDVVNSAQLVAKLKRFARDYDVVIKYEQLKAHIRGRQKAIRRPSFFHPFHSDRPLREHLKELYDTKVKKK